MTQFKEDGKQYRPVDETAYVQPLDKLPVGTYTIGNDLMGWFFTRIEDYSLGKIYGNVEAQAKRIQHTFNSRPAGTGLMLSGEKGCGKTMLAKLLSIKLMEEGVPTFVINSAYCGEEFNKLIQSIVQPCVIIFDEFEKVYDANGQNKLLTLLDGVYPSKKLFILTTNDRYGISQHMRNRPGRLFYHLQYQGLEEAFVIDYCKDNLNNQANMQGVVNLIELFEHFNFDMLKAVVEEMNRYNETAKEAMVMMNIAAESWSQRFTVKVTDDKTGEVLELSRDSAGSQMINPGSGFNVYFFKAGTPKELPDKEDPKYQTVNRTRSNNSIGLYVEEEHMISAKKGVYTYKTDGYTITLTKAQYTPVSYGTLAMAA